MFCTSNWIRSFVRFNTHPKQRVWAENSAGCGVGWDYLRITRGASVWLYTKRPPACSVREMCWWVWTDSHMTAKSLFSMFSTLSTYDQVTKRELWSEYVLRIREISKSFKIHAHRHAHTHTIRTLTDKMWWVGHVLYAYTHTCIVRVGSWTADNAGCRIGGGSCRKDQEDNGRRAVFLMQ